MLYDYNYQAKENIRCFLTDTEYLERRLAFKTFFEEFQKNNVRFGLICSSSLFFMGLVDDFHDFDVLIDSRDAEEVKNIMAKHNAKLVETGGNGFCESDVYMHYQLDRVDVDILGGFKLLTYGTSYQYNFSSTELNYIDIDGYKVPLIPAEAQYLLYSMMEGWQAKRRYKRLLLEDFLLRNLKYPNILRNAMSGDYLPNWIRGNISTMIFLDK